MQKYQPCSQATFSLHTMLYFWWCHLYWEDFWCLLICILQSVVCGLRSAVCKCHTLLNTSSRFKWSQYWRFWFDKTVVSNKCILASLHTLHTHVLVDKFKKCGISESHHSLIIILVKLLNADCHIHLSAYLRGVLVWYYCLGVGCSFRVRPFS